MKMNVPLDMNGERIINSPFIKPPMLAFPGKYLKTRVDKYVFFGGTDIKITPTSCKLTKLYFHTPELGFTDNFCFFSVDIMTKHSRSYSYAGKSWPYQVISPNLAISFGNAVRISLRNEDPPLPSPPQKKSQEATVMWCYCLRQYNARLKNINILYMKNKEDIFHFNHIDPGINKEKLPEIKL